MCGRNAVLDADDQAFLRELTLSQPSGVRLRKLTQQFCLLNYGDVDVGPCVSTIRRELKRIGLSRKKITRVHQLCCPIEGLEFISSIAFVHPSYLINIDGMVQANKDRFALLAPTLLLLPPCFLRLVTPPFLPLLSRPLYSSPPPL